MGNRTPVYLCQTKTLMGNRTPVSTFVRPIDSWATGHLSLLVSDQETHGQQDTCLYFCQTKRLMGNRTPVSTFVRPRDSWATGHLYQLSSDQDSWATGHLYQLSSDQDTHGQKLLKDKYVHVGLLKNAKCS